MSRDVDAETMVVRFLRLVESRNIEEASSLLAPDATITFPGGRHFSNLHDQVASSATRFRSVAKNIEQVDVVEQGRVTVVYVLGTLEGVDAEGRSFSGVRFIDRFEVGKGKIIDHRVWNDVAESGVVRRDR